MRLYRLIIAVLLPIVLARALWRGESRADLAERLGHVAAGGGPVLWLHGASNGELTSARWLVKRLLAARPGLQIRVTTNTLSARRMVQDWGLAGVTATLAPLDTTAATARVLDRWQPRALISLEAEVWPTRIATCAARSVPVLMVGARMSARSFRGWQRLGGLAAAALGKVSLVSAQDALSRRHFVQLGLPEAVLEPDFDLKAEAVASLPAPVPVPRADRAGWLLAASTHDGEDAAVLDAFAKSDFAHLILAPRHPARAAAIAALVSDRGLSLGQRSKGAQPGEARVYLADTLGEMDLWYAMSGACLIGGTFADKGGHTPWEPARHACAILHGPSVWNFTAAFAALDATGAAMPVTNATLAEALARLDATSQDRMSAAATRVLRASGDPDTLVHRILTQTGL